MRRALGLLALLFLAAGAPLRAGTLRALDGRTGAGPLSWEGGTVAAATPQGPLRLSLDQLRLARFAEPAAETGAPGEGVPRRFTPAPRFGGRPGFVKAEYFLNRDLTEIDRCAGRSTRRTASATNCSTAGNIRRGYRA